jgi:phosphatidylethanolamine-binding protein (PEBP) family uncharacterized protein
MAFSLRSPEFQEGYMGPAPPGKKAHRYIFRLYALDTSVGLGEGANRRQLERAMQGHVLGLAEFTGTYARGRPSRSEGKPRIMPSR